MNIRRQPSPQEGNIWYPLPPDYPKLTEEGQREARGNALCVQETPEDLVQAWAFFRHHYLKPLPEGVWYQPPVAPSPPFHYKFVYDMGKWTRNAVGFPRGAAKSKILKELLLLWALTRPHFRICLVKSADEFVRDDFVELKLQIDENEFILRDFGQLKHKRGQGAWSDHRIWLKNGFYLAGHSVMGKIPGRRPDLYAFDDAEFDPGMRVNPTILTVQLEYIYKNHVLPALREGCSFLMLGTLLTRKTFLYRLCTASEKEEPGVAFINRVIMAAEEPDGTLLWPEYWSRDSLDRIKLELGSAAYGAQMLNNPGTEQERQLKLDRDLAYYDVPNPDELLKSQPLDSLAHLETVRRVKEAPDGSPLNFKQQIQYHLEGRKDEVSRPFGETVSKMYRVLLADPIRKPSVKSDFACVMVIGVERSKVHKDAWFVLDLKLGKPQESQFVQWIWDMGCKWRVKLVGIESVSVQKVLVERVAIEFADRAVETGWMPRVLPIKYHKDTAKKYANPDLGKGARISSIAWRFEQGRIKYPRHLIGTTPWSSLLGQTENFTEDLRLLQHDDAIDTLAMMQFVPRAPPHKEEVEALAESAMDLLAKGEMQYPGSNVPVLGAVNAHELTPAALAGLEKRMMLDQDRSDGQIRPKRCRLRGAPVRKPRCSSGAGRRRRSSYAKMSQGDRRRR